MGDVVPSEELRAFLQRFYAVWQRWDFDSMREMISAKPHSLVIGTDPAEWWIGPDGLDIWEAQSREMGNIAIRPGSISAHGAGSVGWIADQPELELDGGLVVRLRVTAVVAIERGQWRFVQMHASLGQANEQALGRKLTTGIENIERTVQAERPDLRPASAPDGTVTIAWATRFSCACLAGTMPSSAARRTSTVATS
jgi:hypothetical protein